MDTVKHFLVTPKEAEEAAGFRPFQSDMSLIMGVVRYAGVQAANRILDGIDMDDLNWVKACELHAVFTAGYIQGKREERERKARVCLCMAEQE